MERSRCVTPQTRYLCTVPFGERIKAGTMSSKRTLASSSGASAHAHEVEARAAKEARLCEQEQDEKEEKEDAAKRMREACTKMEDEYTCPITLQLPTDPVTAEDGRIYERRAIEEWLATHASVCAERGKKVAKSPCSGILMGCCLFPATNVRNAIEHAIQGGMFFGDRAESWLNRRREAVWNKKMVTEIEKKAESGNKESAHALSKLYSAGENGLKKDEKMALKWAERAATLGHAFAATQVGLAYYCGRDGLKKNHTLGMAYMHAGAVLGSECGCYEVGYAYEHGKCNFPEDHQMAAYWYGRMEHAPVRDAGKFDRREKAAEFLKAQRDDD